jgi:hypothetical protein
VSVFYDCVNAVKNEVESVLTPLGVPVSVRRRNVYLNADPLPICIISPGETEEVRELDFTGGTTWLYPIIVNLVYPDDRNNDLALDAQEYLDIREAIRNKLYFPLLNGVEEVWDVELVGTKPFTLVDQKSTYSSTLWLVSYKSKEQRRMT